MLLALQKTGSTALERSFGSHAGVSLQKNPFKHTNYAQFQRFLEPWLKEKGFSATPTRSSTWCASPSTGSQAGGGTAPGPLARPNHPRHKNYAGHHFFEQFARAHMEESEPSAQVQHPSEFVRLVEEGTPGVDLLFRYERLDLLVDYLCGKDVEVAVRNVSPERPFSLSEEAERDLRAFFASENGLHARAIGG